MIDHCGLSGLETLDNLAEAIVRGAWRHSLVAEHQAGPEVDAGNRLLAIEADAPVLVYQGGAERLHHIDDDVLSAWAATQAEAVPASGRIRQLDGGVAQFGERRGQGDAGGVEPVLAIIDPVDERESRHAVDTALVRDRLEARVIEVGAALPVGDAVSDVHQRAHRAQVLESLRGQCGHVGPASRHDGRGDLGHEFGIRDRLRINRGVRVRLGKKRQDIVEPGELRLARESVPITDRCRREGFPGRKRRSRQQTAAQLHRRAPAYFLGHRFRPLHIDSSDYYTDISVGKESICQFRFASCEDTDRDSGAS